MKPPACFHCQTRSFASFRGCTTGLSAAVGSLIIEMQSWLHSGRALCQLVLCVQGGDVCEA